MFPKSFAIAAAVIFLGVAAFVFSSWLGAHDDRLGMQATLTAQKQLLAAAQERDEQRARELRDTLAEIAALKRQTRTPEQIVRELPQYLALPQPIEIAPPPAVNPRGERPPGASEKGAAGQARRGGQGSGAAEKPAEKSVAEFPPAQSVAQIPVEDLKPLFDFVQDSRACQVSLTAARADLRDEQAQSAALAKERDAAVKAAKGGGFWARVKRNAKWLAIGVGVGAAFARVAH